MMFLQGVRKNIEAIVSKTTLNAKCYHTYRIFSREVLSDVDDLRHRGGVSPFSFDRSYPLKASSKKSVSSLTDFSEPDKR